MSFSPYSKKGASYSARCTLVCGRLPVIPDRDAIGDAELGLVHGEPVGEADQLRRDLRDWRAVRIRHQRPASIGPCDADLRIHSDELELGPSGIDGELGERASEKRGDHPMHARPIARSKAGTPLA